MGMRVRVVLYTVTQGIIMQVALGVHIQLVVVQKIIGIVDLLNEVVSWIFTTVRFWRIILYL